MPGRETAGVETDTEAPGGVSPPTARIDRVASTAAEPTDENVPPD
jgi:hypothetical protein